MIYVAFSDHWDSTGRTICVFQLDNFSEFSNWISSCDPKELYVSENREDILKYLNRMVD